MRIVHHTTIGVLAALPMSLASPAGALSFLGATILPDMDHLLFYVYHERKLPPPTITKTAVYHRWRYFGPRIHVFHNYEVLSALAVVAWLAGGIWTYIFSGVLVHAVCDQLETKIRFGFFRIRFLFGDILRYRQYIQVCREGGEKKYMLHRRDSWRNHLKKALPEDRLRKAETDCGILRLYPEEAPDDDADSSQWTRIL